MQGKVEKYMKDVAHYPDPCLDRCRQLKGIPINEIIDVAASAIGTDGKMNRHQCRQGGELLASFAKELRKSAIAIDQCDNFPDLLALIENIGFPIYGIGELTCYDTADRIRAAKGMELDAVYMHAGTKAGAIAVLGVENVKGKKLPKLDFPAPFQSLSCEQIENILCIFFAPKKRGVIPSNRGGGCVPDTLLVLC